MFLALITTFLLPWFFKLLDFVNINLSHLLNNFYEKIDVKIAMGYTGYFMLGHYLKNKTFNSSTRTIIYILGLISLICVVVFTHFISFHYNHADIFFYDNLSILTLAEAIAIFTLINHKFKNYKSKYSPIIVKVSNLTFGVYLIHILIINIFHDSFGIDSCIGRVSWGIPVLSIITFSFSLILTWFLNKIPYASRFIL